MRTCDNSVLARPLSVSHILGTMREILPGIFTWGSTYADRPWDLNGYAIIAIEPVLICNFDNARNGLQAARGNAVTFLLASPSDRIRS